MEDLSEEIKKIKSIKQKDWLDKTSCEFHNLLPPRLVSLKPELGYLIHVDMLDVPAEIFPEEYKKITEAYQSVLDKLEEHYKTLK